MGTTEANGVRSAEMAQLIESGSFSSASERVKVLNQHSSMRISIRSHSGPHRALVTLCGPLQAGFRGELRSIFAWASRLSSFVFLFRIPAYFSEADILRQASIHSLQNRTMPRAGFLEG